MVVHQDDYEANGFAGPIDIVTREEAQRAFDEVCSELKVDPVTHILKNSQASDRFKLHLVLPTLDAIAHHPKVIAAVQEALRTKDVFLWSSDINWKVPGSEGFFAPHQDSTYAGLLPASKCLTAWIALSDPVGENEGCLSFFPKSHTKGQLLHEQAKQECAAGDNNNIHNENHNGNHKNNMLSLGQYISQSELQKLDHPDPVAVPLRAGQMTLHSFLTVHASGPNRSVSGPRVGFALRYMDANVVRQTKSICKEMVTCISSSWPLSNAQSPLHFDLEPRLPTNPTQHDIQHMLEIRAEAIRREEANYFG
jgi:non-haem Fe2+, alpha-ketoglutarate-dependent halogenase